MYSVVSGFSVAVLMGVLGFGQASMPTVTAQPQPDPKSVPSARVRGNAYLGVGLMDVMPERVGALRLPNDKGVEIMGIDQDGPAARAGLREHDVVVHLNGQPIMNSTQLRGIIQESQAGRWISLGVYRDGQWKEFKVQLGKRMQVATVPSNRVPAMILPAPPPKNLDIPQFSVLQFWSRNGLMLEDITPQLGEFFGVRNGEGVLVRSVERGSFAAAAGLKAGDVIIKVDRDRISCSSEWRHAIRNRSGSVTLVIVRDRREQTVTMRLPERKTNGSDSGMELPTMGPMLEDLRAELEELEPQFERSLHAAYRHAIEEINRTLREMERQAEESRQGEELHI